MSNLEIGLLSFPFLLVLIFLRVPIGLAMFLAGFFGLGLVMGFVRLRTRSIWSTLFIHGVYNLAAMLLVLGLGIK